MAYVFLTSCRHCHKNKYLATLLKVGSDPKGRKSVSIEEGNNATNQGLFASVRGVRQGGKAAGCIVTAFETALIY